MPPWDRHSPAWQRLDDKLPPHHLARQIDQAVAALDLTNLFAAYAGTGSLAHRPDLLLKVVLYEVRRKRLSPAQWAEDFLLDEACQWLAFGIQPTRARLYAFRDRLGPLLRDCHNRLIGQAVAEELTAASQSSLDGSAIAANASRHRLLNAETLDKRRHTLAAALQADTAAAGSRTPLPQATSGAAAPATAVPAADKAAVAATTVPAANNAAALPALVVPEGEASHAVSAAAAPTALPGADMPTAVSGADRAAVAGGAAETTAAHPEPPTVPAWLATTPAGRQAQAQRYQAAHEQLQARLAANRQRPASKRLAPKAVRVSTADVEAVLGLDKFKVYRPLYNVQCMPDLNTPLVLAYGVFAQPTDAGTLPPLLGRYHQATGRFPDDLLVDLGYATALDLAVCETAGVTMYAPHAAQTKGKAKPVKQIPKEAFRWEAAEQVYVCPQGHRLEREYAEVVKRKGDERLRVYTYRCPPAHCAACPRQGECARTPRGRTIKRSEHEELVEALKARMQTAEAKQLYRRRCQTVELNFADFKEHRGLRRFRGRGRDRAETEVGLVVLAHNVLAVLALRQQKEQEEDLTPELSSA